MTKKMTKQDAERLAHAKFRVRTQRVRAMAVRQGYRLAKVRRVDRLALDFNTFELWDGEHKVNNCGRRLDDIEAYLLSDPRKQQVVVARIAQRVVARRGKVSADNGRRK